MQIRRVVTGHDTEGRSVFLSDEVVEPITSAARPGYEFHRLWNLEDTPSLPEDQTGAVDVAFFPPVGGVRFLVYTRPPDSTPAAVGVDRRTARAETEAVLPGLASVEEADDPGMHTTDSVDLHFVVSGEITLELDGGVEKVLRVGDVIVQNGTRHRWHTRSDAPATLVSVNIGARRVR